MARWQTTPRRTAPGSGLSCSKQAFLGEAAHLTREQVEQTATDFPPERTRGLWRALGFVDPAPASCASPRLTSMRFGSRSGWRRTT